MSSIWRNAIYLESGTDCLHSLDTFTETKSHLAVVCDVNNEVSGRDPIYIKRGIVTLEDIIEVLLAQDIGDEFDENVHKKELDNQREQLVMLFMERRGCNVMSVEERKAVVAFLGSYVTPFKYDRMKSEVLDELISDIVNNSQVV